jgi:hypothetical protein
MMEVWKEIPGYEENYEVSNLGNIRSKVRDSIQKGRWGIARIKLPAKLMKISTTSKGYCYVGLAKNGKTTKHLLHRLVLSAYVGESDLQCNHKDGDKSNNKLSNLEYCTPLENIRHCIDILGKKKGGFGASSKLSLDQVMAIRNDRRILREIAAEYGVTLQAIHHIRSGKNWKHI